MKKEEKLVDRYAPYDYRDSVSGRMKTAGVLTAEELYERMFCHLPKPVAWLMRVRNVLVKPLGLQGGGGFRDLVVERNEEEVVACKDDRHLCFWVSVCCSQPEEGWQEVSVTTVVRFHNLLGRVYFIGIWVFHKLLVKGLFRKATRVRE